MYNRTQDYAKLSWRQHVPLSGQIHMKEGEDLKVHILAITYVSKRQFQGIFGYFI